MQILNNSSDMSEVLCIEGKYQDLNVLSFVHHWKFPICDLILEKVKENIFLNKYEMDDLVKYLSPEISTDLFKTTEDMAKIVLSGNLWLVKYARDNGCEWDELACSCAAHNGIWIVSCTCMKMVANGTSALIVLRFKIHTLNVPNILN